MRYVILVASVLFLAGCDPERKVPERKETEGKESERRKEMVRKAADQATKKTATAGTTTGSRRVIKDGPVIAFNKGLGNAAAYEEWLGKRFSVKVNLPGELKMQGDGRFVLITPCGYEPAMPKMSDYWIFDDPDQVKNLAVSGKGQLVIEATLTDVHSHIRRFEKCKIVSVMGKAR